LVDPGVVHHGRAEQQGDLDAPPRNRQLSSATSATKATTTTTRRAYAVGGTSSGWRRDRILSRSWDLG
jgi:hypothetical protein